MNLTNFNILGLSADQMTYNNKVNILSEIVW